jgi:hypothetical protein
MVEGQEFAFRIGIRQLLLVRPEVGGGGISIFDVKAGSAWSVLVCRQWAIAEGVVKPGLLLNLLGAG